MTLPVELYACIYAREFPAQALLRLRPWLRGKPCAVMEGDPPVERVCSLTKAARVLGLLCGMTRVEADTFHAVTKLPRSRQGETTAAAILIECAGMFSPHVEFKDEDGAFRCVIDIAGTEKLFGSPQSLTENLLTRVRSFGIAVSIAVSRNFHAAVCIAKELPPQTARVISMGDEATALAPLPLAVLDLTEEQAETFSLWGIRTLGMLAVLPEKELIARMGQAGKCLRQLSRGVMPHLFQPVEPTFTLAEKMELDSPVEMLDSLLFFIGVILDQLILRVTSRVLALASVTITLSLDGGATQSRTVRPALPTNDKQLWIKLLQLDLEAHSPQAAILTLSLEAEPGCTSKVQLGLFSPQLPEPSRLNVTLARIRALVGDGNAGRAVLKDTNQAEGFHVEPFSLPATRPFQVASDILRSSLRILRPPEGALVTLHRQRPRTIVFREQRYSVEQAYGPWLSSGEWWSSTLWKQEEWDLVARAENSALLCCRLVHNPVENCWRMTALYD